MRALTAMAAAVLALVLGLSARPASAAPPLQALSPQDVQAYTAAYDAAERGDYAAAEQELARVSDPCLVGKIQYLKLVHAGPRTNTFEQLAGWLKAFGDLPGADKIYALALKLKPAGAMPPAPPSAPPIATADDVGEPIASPQSRPAREAYFNADLQRAFDRARADRDAWIAGLSAYRLGRYADAMSAFETIAANVAETDAQRAAGAYWAARSAAAAGAPEHVPALLKIAAAAPDTFYGMIAARKLQLLDDPLDGVIEAAIANRGAAVLSSAAYSADDMALARLATSDPRARRAVALSQLGRPVDAGAELRAGLALAPDESSRALWMKLIFALSPSAPRGEVVLHTAAAAPPSVRYPTPDLAPAGGFTVDKALVYAVTWQESRFNGMAVSPVGAVGLMQLMPPSAASVAGDSSLAADPVPLFDQGVNLQLGQAYLNWLMNKAVGYDILRALAAYNGGPSVVGRTLALLGPNADSLLLVESLPFAQTRAYVRKVMAAYWSYRRQFGVPSRTLDALASDAPFIDARLDAASQAVPGHTVSGQAVLSQTALRQDPKPASAAEAREALEILLRHP
ncbi:MAG: lytic transglycosylase domain-containing protein [Caulobacteraceae bacterium]|nr:lytic transglycosylase domain-containing protein [Caulobacteraceae bacterium]